MRWLRWLALPLWPILALLIWLNEGSSIDAPEHLVHGGIQQ